MKDLRDLLKSGRIIELRNGRKYLICGNVLMGTEGYLTTPAYNKKLQEINDGGKEWDIMRIYNPIRVSLQDVLKDLEKAEVIWSRSKARPGNLKSLLQTGMRVTLRNGKKYIVLRGHLSTAYYGEQELIFTGTTFIIGAHYTNELLHNKRRDYDVIKVETVNISLFDQILTTEALGVVYEEK